MIYYLRLAMAVMFCTALLLLGGCSSVRSMADFRGQRIMVGQSVDSLENHLGQPDWALNYQITIQLVAQRIDWGVAPGKYTVEWGYCDDPKSLIIWIEGNNVRAIWLADTAKLKKTCPPITANRKSAIGNPPSYQGHINPRTGQMEIRPDQRLKVDANGEPAKDEKGNFIFEPVDGEK